MKEKKDDNHSIDSAEHILPVSNIESGKVLDFQVGLMFYNLLLLLCEKISMLINND